MKTCNKYTDQYKIQKAPENGAFFFCLLITAEGREDQRQQVLNQICLFLHLFNIIIIIGNDMRMRLFVTHIMISYL